MELVLQLLILAKQIADFPSTYANIASGDIRIRIDMAEQLAHEALAETHDFHIALALGVEIRAAFAAAHGKAR